MRELLATSFERVVHLGKLGGVQNPSWDRFRTAFEAYITAYAATASHSALANDRFLISVKVYGNCSADIRVQAEAVFHDLASFAPYTEAELDAHTAALEVLTTAFDNLNAASTAFKRGDSYYATALGCCQATAKSYADAADSYSRAVSVARVNAREIEIQSTSKAVADRDVSAPNALKQKLEAAYKKAEAFETKARGFRRGVARTPPLLPPERLRDTEAVWAILTDGKASQPLADTLRGGFLADR